MNADATRFLETLSPAPARFYKTAVHDLFVARVTGNKTAALDSLFALGETIAETMGAAELLGAMFVLQRAHAELSGGRGRFNATGSQTILPRVKLTEAVEGLVSRVPKTVQNAAERTAQRIAKLYSSGNYIAFARSADIVVTEEAQRFIARAMAQGTPEGAAGKALAMAVNEVRTRTEEWSEAYARMAFRTNVNTAVTAGRFQQAQDPDIREVIPALRFDAVGDADTRANHAAADGLILSADSPEWRRIAPPLGYNCRCQVSLVSVLELEAQGRIRNGKVIDDRVPSGAGPDEGFRFSGVLPT